MGVPSRLPPSTTIISAPRARSGASASSAATMIAASSSAGMTIVSRPMGEECEKKPRGQGREGAARMIIDRSDAYCRRSMKND
jgi:hypothetical protein